MREAEIQAQIRKALGAVPGAVFWRNNVGLTGHSSTCPKCGHIQQDEEDGPRIRYGLCKGSSDLIGMLYPSGRLIALEVKTPKGRATPEQLLFLDLVRRRGGFATIVRSPEEALAAIDRCRAGLSE